MIRIWVGGDEGSRFEVLRALSSALSNVPNAKYLAHLTHQIQKQTLMRCAKCLKIMRHATVRSQI